MADDPEYDRAFADGMSLAAHVASECKVVGADKMSPVAAAECMQRIIVGSLRASSDMIRQSAIHRSLDAVAEPTDRIPDTGPFSGEPGR